MPPLIADVSYDPAVLDHQLAYNQMMQQTGGIIPEAVIIFGVPNFAPPFFQLCLDQNWPSSTIYIAPFSMFSSAIPLKIRPNLIYSTVMPDILDISYPIINSFNIDRAAAPPGLSLAVFYLNSKREETHA